MSQPKNHRRFALRARGLFCAVMVGLVAGPLFAGGEGGLYDDDLFASIQVGYDDLGRIESFTYPHRAVATYTYNAREAQKRLTYDGVEVVPSTLFAPTGHIIERTIVDRAGGPLAVENRSFDPLSRLREQRLSLGGQTVYSATDMTYDARGFLVGVHRSDQLISDADLSFAYTEQGQLDSFSVGSAQTSYDYDSRGNLLSRSGLTGFGLYLPSYTSPGTFDTANRPSSSSYRYDAAGRLEEDPDLVYTYNEAGYLALVEDHQGALVAHYLYDADGNRVRKMTESSVTYYYRSGGEVVSEETYDFEGELLDYKDFVSHNDKHVLTADYGSSTTFEYQLSDRLGNPVVRWVDGDVSLQEFSPFGVQMNTAPADTRDGPFGFTGHENDAETGDVYMRARYFDPVMARFATPDAARDVDPYAPASYNLYQYTRNNPVNLVDPTGDLGEEASQNDDEDEEKECENATCPHRADPNRHLRGGVLKTGIGLAILSPATVISGFGDLTTSFNNSDETALPLPDNAVVAFTGSMVYEASNNADAAAVVSMLTEVALVAAVPFVGSKSVVATSPKVTAYSAAIAAVYSANDQVGSFEVWQHYFNQHAVRIGAEVVKLSRSTRQAREERRRTTWNPFWVESSSPYREGHFHYARDDGKYTTPCGTGSCRLSKGKGYSQ